MMIDTNSTEFNKIIENTARTAAMVARDEIQKPKKVRATPSQTSVSPEEAARMLGLLKEDGTLRPAYKRTLLNMANDLKITQYRPSHKTVTYDLDSINDHLSKNSKQAYK